MMVFVFISMRVISIMLFMKVVNEIKVEIKKSKDILSSERLSRILWIKDVLEDPTATMYVGFDNKTKRYDRTKRVAVVKGNYVVVIQIYAKGKANFITAYVANNSIDKIEQGPRW